MFKVDLSLTKELEEFVQLFHDLLVRYGGWSKQKEVTATKVFLRGGCDCINEILAEIDEDLEDAKSEFDSEARVRELEDFKFKFTYIQQRLNAEGESL